MWRMKIISMYPKNFNFGFPSHFRVLKGTELVWTRIESNSINWKKSHSSANVNQIKKSETWLDFGQCILTKRTGILVFFAKCSKADVQSFTCTDESSISTQLCKVQKPPYNITAYTCNQHTWKVLFWYKSEPLCSNTRNIWAYKRNHF